MSSFVKYFAETKKEYKYVLKFAIHEMNDAILDSLEKGLQKYDLKSASKFRKTPIQESPLDFPNVKNSEVFISDIVLGYPASLDFLRQYVCNCTGIPELNVAVYSDNDPRQIETDLFIDRSSPDFKKNYKPVMGTEYSDSDDNVNAEDATYGEKYNTDFLKELEKVRKDRKFTKIINPLSQEEKTDHSDLTSDYHKFNDDKHLVKDDVGLFGRIKRPDFSKPGSM